MATNKPEPNRAVSEPAIAPLKLRWTASEWDSKRLDFRIRIGEDVVAASSDVLKARSDYFSAMFSSGMKEAQNASMDAVGMDAAVVRLVLDLMHGKPVTIPWTNIAEFLDVTEHWQVWQPRTRVEGYLREHLAPENLDLILSLGSQYHMKGVMDSVHQYMSQHFLEVMGRVEFLSMELEHLKQLCPPHVIRDISADHKLEGCVQWLQHRTPKHRAQCSNDLAVHFNLAFSESFLHLLRSYSNGAITTLRQYISLEGISLLRPVNNGCTVLAFGAEDLVEPKVKSLLKLDFQTETMDTIGTLPSFFEEPLACCWTPYGIFAVNVKHQCGVLDIHSLNYLRLPDLPVTLTSMRAVFHSWKVCVLGQDDVRARVCSVDLSTQRPGPSHWVQTGLQCDDPLSGHMSPLCKVGVGVFWLSQGHQLKSLARDGTSGTSWKCLSRAETSMTSWTSRDVLQTQHPWNSCLAGVGPLLYILGHVAPTRNCCYNTNLNSRNSIAPSLLPRPGQCHAVFLPGLHSVVLCGGFREEIELYHLTSSTWTISQLKMPFKTSMFIMAI